MTTTTPAFHFEPLRDDRLRCAVALPTDRPGRIVFCGHPAEWRMYRYEDDGRCVASVACCWACKAAMEGEE